MKKNRILLGLFLLFCLPLSAFAFKGTVSSDIPIFQIIIGIIALIYVGVMIILTILSLCGNSSIKEIMLPINIIVFLLTFFLVNPLIILYMLSAYPLVSLAILVLYAWPITNIVLSLRGKKTDNKPNKS